MIAYLLLILRFQYDNYKSKGAFYWPMNADVTRGAFDKRLWELFVELICTLSEALELGANDFIKIIADNPKAEVMIMALCSSVAKDE